MGQAVGGELDLMVLIGGAEGWVTIQWVACPSKAKVTH
jgi:hypothetical protein